MNQFQNSRFQIILTRIGLVLGFLIICPNSFSQELKLKVVFPKPEIKNRGQYDQVIMPDLINVGSIGQPLLPVKTIKLLIPYGEEKDDIKIIPGKKIEIEGKYLIEPGQKHYPWSFTGIKEPVPPDKVIYDSISPFPAKIYSSLGVQGKQGYNIIFVNLNPLTYIPAEGKLSYYEGMTIIVTTRTSSIKSRTPDPGAKEEISMFVDNPEAINTYPDEKASKYLKSSQLPSANYQHVIITKNALSSYFEPLVNHKMTRSDWVTSTIVTTEWIYANYSGKRPVGGEDNQTKIRNFIDDANENWGTKYALLGGDCDIIPARNLYWDHWTDLAGDIYYGCLDGTWDTDSDGTYGEMDNNDPQGTHPATGIDYLYDVYVGRAFIRQTDTAGFSNFVNKTIAYENSTSDYCQKVCLLAPWTNTAEKTAAIVAETEQLRLGYSDSYETKGFIHSSFFNVQTYYCPYGDTSYNYRLDLINTINDGVHLINHIGHGPAFGYGTGLDFLYWTNSEYFFAYTQGCDSGAFKYGSQILLQRSMCTQHGCFGYVANSCGGWPYVNTHFNREFWDACLGDNITSLSHMNAKSKEDNLGRFGLSIAMGTEYYELNLFGDPETHLHIGPKIPDRVVLDSGDYNGDGSADIAIFRPYPGLWAIRGQTTCYYGTNGDISVSGDYNGDSTTDIGVFRKSSGLWAIRNQTHFYLGASSDIPVPGDYNGDGTTDSGIYRGSSGLWSIRNITSVYYGTSSDIPVPGDYNGDGTKDIALFRGSNNRWYLRNIGNIYFGINGDQPVPGDYDGGNTWEIGIFRPSSGLWAIKDLTRSYFGSSTDRLVQGDYDADGSDDMGIFRASRSLWAISGITSAYFGGFGDIPSTR